MEQGMGACAVDSNTIHAKLCARDEFQTLQLAKTV